MIKMFKEIKEETNKQMNKMFKQLTEHVHKQKKKRYLIVCCPMIWKEAQKRGFNTRSQSRIWMII